MSLALLGLAWGSLRADALDRSALALRIGEAGDARVAVTGPPRSTPFSIRVPVEVRRFAGLVVRERALLEIRSGRAPPRGAVLEIVRARLVAPRGPETGFDERAWLARRGIHVVLRADEARIVGRRGGIGGVADGLRAHLERTLERGARGERLALLRGFVLGDDSALDPGLRQAFRASGLAHMTAVSGQNVAIVAVAIGAAAWLLGIGRVGVHLAAIAAILAYALAVGWEPSVVRAAVAGCVGSLAWLASRADDRWHALALGALVLLAWQPASLLEPGFQLSFAAVAAILVVVPHARSLAEGYPIPPRPGARCRGVRSLQHRDGSDQLGALRRHCGLERAGEPRRRAGHAGRADALAGGCRHDAALAGGGWLARLARRVVCRLDRGVRAAVCLASVRPGALTRRSCSPSGWRSRFAVALWRMPARRRAPFAAAAAGRGVCARGRVVGDGRSTVLGATRGPPSHLSRRGSG